VASFFPFDFFVALVKRLSVRGTQKRDKTNHVIVRVQKFNPGQIKYVRTLVVFFIFFSAAPWFFCFLRRPLAQPLGAAQRRSRRDYRG
jgi:hypothetical protein